MAPEMKEAYEYTMEGIAGQIQCPCLVLQADADMFLPCLLYTSRCV